MRQLAVFMLERVWWVLPRQVKNWAYRNDAWMRQQFYDWDDDEDDDYEDDDYEMVPLTGRESCAFCGCLAMRHAVVGPSRPCSKCGPEKCPALGVIVEYGPSEGE